MSNKEAILVEEFEYRGKQCCLVKMHMPTRRDFHNGYVKVAEDAGQVAESCYKDLDALIGGPKSDYTYQYFNSELDAAELTFSGTTKALPDGFWFGFDSAHAWNDKRPDSKTHESVKNRLKDLVDEMIEENVFEQVVQGES